MDTRRLTDAKAKHNDSMDTVVGVAKVMRDISAREYEELNAKYQSLRADAAELARLVDRWQDSSGNLGEFRDRLKVARELLSRPTVVELRKEKD